MNIKINYKLYDISILVYFCALLSHVTYIPSDTNIFFMSAVFVSLCTALNLLNNCKIYKTKYLLWYFIFSLFMILSIFWALEPSKILSIFSLSVPVIIFSGFILSQYMINQERINNVLNFIIIAGVYCAIRCLLNTDFSSFFSYYNRGMFAAKLLTEGLSYNSFTAPLALITVIAIYSAYYTKRKIYYFVYIFITLTLLISGSRKTIVISILGIILLTLLYKRDGKILRKIMIVSLVLFGAYYILMCVPVLYNAVGKIMQEMVYSLFISNSTITDHSLIERTFYRKEAWNVFLKNPILGVGIDNFSTTLEAINYSHAVYSHNNFLELLADGGIIGFLVYYSFYIKVLYRAIKEYIKRNSKSINVLLIVFIICLLIMEYGQITYFNISVQLIIAIITLAYTRREL